MNENDSIYSQIKQKMAKNKIEDLRDHLFMQLERLNNESLKGDELEKELSRAKSISEVSQVIVNSVKVEVDFLKALGGNGKGTTFIPIDGRAEDNKQIGPAPGEKKK